MILKALKKRMWRWIPNQVKAVNNNIFKFNSFENKNISLSNKKLAQAWVKTNDIEYVIWQSNLPKKLKIMDDCTFLDGDWDMSKESFVESNIYKSFYEHFVQKVPWEYTDYHACLKKGHFPKRVEKRGSVIEFLKVYDRLFYDMKKEGFNKLHPIIILIGRDGEFIRYDGSHRLAIAKIQKLPLIPVRVKLIHQSAFRISIVQEILKNNFSKYTGTVISGRGKTESKFKKWNKIFDKKINKIFYPGSLNLVLQEPIMLNTNKALNFANKYFLWNGIIDDVPVYLLRWNRCPLHIIEVLSKHRLRDFFRINDGEAITISIKNDYVSDLALSKRIAWFVLWKKREYLYYSSDYYYNILRKKGLLKKLNHNASQQDVMPQKVRKLH